MASCRRTASSSAVWAGSWRLVCCARSGQAAEAVRSRQLGHPNHLPSPGIAVIPESRDGMTAALRLSWRHNSRLARTDVDLSSLVDSFRFARSREWTPALVVIVLSHGCWKWYQIIGNRMPCLIVRRAHMLRSTDQMRPDCLSCDWPEVGSRRCCWPLPIC